MDFQTLVDHHSTDIFRFLLSLTQHTPTAEDLTQDVFVTAMGMGHKLTNHPNPKALLFKLSSYTYRDYRRKAARRSRLAPTEQLNDQLVAPTHDPAHTIAEQARLQTLHTLIAQLPDRYRLPIVMHYQSELIIADIAQAMGIPHGTVKSRLHKARQLLQKGMVTHGYTHY